MTSKLNNGFHVSNFQTHHLERLRNEADETPAADEWCLRAMPRMVEGGYRVACRTMPVTGRRPLTWGEPMRRPVLALLAALALLTAGAGLAGPATAAPQPPPGLPVYLAFGDSVAAGQASVPPATDFATTEALWHANGYVARFAETLRTELDCLPAASEQAQDGCRQLQRIDYSRTAIPGGPGGVTTATMLGEGDQLDRAVALLRDRNGDKNPRNDVEVVTLTVGGNDIFGPITRTCLPTVGPDCQAAVATAFDGFATNYAQILGELRAAAGPDVTIMTMTYYNPIPGCFLATVAPASVALGDYVLEQAPVSGLGEVGFNGLITALSQQAGAVVVDTYGDLGTDDLVGGADCLHPNGAGHDEIAEQFAAAFPG